MKHKYTCEDCGQTKTCGIAGCQGTCVKICLKCVRKAALRPPAGFIRTPAKPHLQDSDCTVDPNTGCCQDCGVDHSEQCPECQGRGFHRMGCGRIC